ncbi:MAG: DMT family transporter [Beijerinckiaceae bacterium]
MAKAPGASGWLSGNAYLLLSLTNLLWAGNTVAARLAVGNVSPMLLVLLRWVLACAVLAFLARTAIKADWPQLKTRLPYLFLMGAFGYTGFNALFYVAGHHTTAINMGILQGAMPVIVLIAGALMYRDRASPIQWLGTAITLMGVALVASGGDLATLRALTFNIGDIWMLIAGVLYAVYTVALKNRPAASAIGFFAFMAFAAALTSVPLVVAEWQRGELLMPTWQGWLLIAYIGLGPSLAAQLMFMRGVQLIGAARAGIFINLVPVVGPMLAILILGERFGWHHVAALALVLGGIYVAERGRRPAA